MNTPLSWIRAYVPDLDVTEQEYMDAMTMSGTKVEGYEKFDADLANIIVGKIQKIDKHPDADRPDPARKDRPRGLRPLHSDGKGRGVHL